MKAQWKHRLATVIMLVAAGSAMTAVASQRARPMVVDPKTRTAGAIYGSMVAALGRHPVFTIRLQHTVHDPAATWTRTVQAHVSRDASAGVDASSIVRYERWENGTPREYRRRQVIHDASGFTYITSDDWAGSLKGKWFTYRSSTQAEPGFGSPLAMWLDDGSLDALTTLDDVVPISAMPAPGEGWLVTGTIPAYRADQALGVNHHHDRLRIDGADNEAGVIGDAVVHLRLDADYLPQHVEIRGDEVAFEQAINEYELEHVQRRDLTLDFVGFGGPLTARVPDLDHRLTAGYTMTNADYTQLDE